jgi:hypothetical protein
MSIFDTFDKQINLAEIEKQKAAAAENSYEEVPAGRYMAKIEKMELGTTKVGGRPMFKVQMRLISGEGPDEQTFLAKYTKKKPCVFMNRVIYGTKNDGSMIASVEGWLNKIDFEEPVIFKGYADFEQVILDCAEECAGLEFAIAYDPAAFNSIIIEEVYG